MLKINEAVDTVLLQEESLTRFAAAIGYETVYDHDLYTIVRFKQPAFRGIGQEYCSVKRMIKMHNTAGEDTFRFIQQIGRFRDEDLNLSDFLDTQGHELIELLFAASCKTVKKVKGQYSRKQGLVIQSNIVEFMSKKDFHHYGEGMDL